MKYKRILLKLSGEALMGDQSYGIDINRVMQYANDIKVTDKYYTHLDTGDILAEIGKVSGL